jgi:hypothetical protein
MSMTKVMTMTMGRLVTLGAFAALTTATAALGSGCAAHEATGQSAHFESRDEILGPPTRLLGEGADLRIVNGRLAGRLEGGAYAVKITPDTAVGSGPMGRIDVRIKRVGNDYDLAGTWNGGPVHFIVGPDGARGHLLKQISAEDHGFESCTYDIEERYHQPGFSGLSDCLGTEPLRFEIAPRDTAALKNEETAILLLAYFAAPPAVNAL